MHNEVKKCVDSGNLKSLRYIFVDCLDVDPTFEKYVEDFEYYWEYIYAPNPGFSFELLPINRIALLREEFLTPVMQLEFDTHLPYVLQIPF